MHSITPNRLQLTLTPLTRESVIPRLAAIAARPLHPWLAVALAAKSVALLVHAPAGIARTLDAAHAGLQIPVAGHAPVALPTLHKGFAHAEAPLLVADSIQRSLDVAVAGWREWKRQRKETNKIFNI